MKANKHISPMEYRIIWKGKGSVEDSAQHYNVRHSSEALDSLAHTLRSGHIHSNIIKVSAVEEWCRFRKIWIDRMKPALLHVSAPEIGSSILIDSIDEAGDEELSNG